ncbi:translocator protein isoform X2 [Brevipalpus obovatus]|uniref:translocator protein isoform X2 n=1 Tax=Brevipalpus obovatus TaxID=246614 RepID=UPI003D9DEE52
MTILTKFGIGLAIGLPNAIGWAGSSLTRNAIPTWYEELKLPSWRPPNRAFPIVWTSLYTAMGYSSYLIWRDGQGFSGAGRIPLYFYGANLALNGLWTPLFFGKKRIDLAMVDILALLGVIGGCIATFHPVNPTASYLLIPYFIWTTFAAALNFQIWRDNRKKGSETSPKSL